jgi:hypothetical protein
MAADRSRVARRIALVLAAAGIAACDAPLVPGEEPGYDATSLTGGLVFRWDLGKTIAVYVDTTSQPSGYDLRATVREGAAFWDDVARYGEYAFAFVDEPQAADVIVRYRQAPAVVDWLGCNPPGSGAGETIFCVEEPEAPVLPLLDGGGGRVKIEVLLDPLWVSEEFLAQRMLTRQQHFQRSAAHELGHVLGIGGHASSEMDLMHGLALAPEVSDRDAATLRWVLRQEADIRL